MSEHLARAAAGVVRETWPWLVLEQAWQIFAYLGAEAIFVFWALTKLCGAAGTRSKKSAVVRAAQTSEVSS